MKERPNLYWNTIGLGLAALVAALEIGEANAFRCGDFQCRTVQQIKSQTTYSFLDQEGLLGNNRQSTELRMTSVEGESNARATAPSVGPKAEGRRRNSRSSDRRTGPRQPRNSSSSSPKAVGPRPSRSDRSSRRRRTDGAASFEGGQPSPPPNPAKQRQPETESPKEEFNGKLFTERQDCNSSAPRLDLRAVLSSGSESGFRCVTQGVQCFDNDAEKKIPKPEKTYEYRSLDDLIAFVLQKNGITSLPKFSLSEKFNSDEAFRKDLRSAIRLDVFETTPFYANLPEKAKTVLLLPDSSLEGSWRIPENMQSEKTENDSTSEDQDDNELNPAVRRMKHTTQVLNKILDNYFDSIEEEDDCERFSFTGDDLFEAIGAICGDGSSTHWIDIYGVQDREINHSWHLDAGRSPKNCRTVLWGFPPEDHYTGTGVFSHIISLEDPFGSTLDIVEDESEQRPRMEPVLFDGTLEEDYIFRPLYEPGKELLIYRDIDVLHSAPDVAYRSSVMRFM